MNIFSSSAVIFGPEKLCKYSGLHEKKGYRTILNSYVDSTTREAFSTLIGTLFARGTFFATRTQHGKISDNKIETMASKPIVATHSFLRCPSILILRAQSALNILRDWLGLLHTRGIIMPSNGNWQTQAQRIDTMRQRSESILDHIAEYLQFLSHAPSFWFTLNTPSYDHGCHLARWFHLDPDHYEVLLLLVVHDLVSLQSKPRLGESSWWVIDLQSTILQ